MRNGATQFVELKTHSAVSALLYLENPKSNYDSFYTSIFN